MVGDVRVGWARERGRASPVAVLDSGGGSVGGWGYQAVIEVERRLAEMPMEWMTRFALILFVRMIARAEQAMLLARSARADVSTGRSFCRPLHGSHHASRDVSR